jgi:hypothetical protein
MSSEIIKRTLVTITNIHTFTALVYIFTLLIFKKTWYFNDPYVELYLLCFAIPTAIIFPVSFYFLKGFYYGGTFKKGRKARNEILGLLLLNVFFIYCLN